MEKRAEFDRVLFEPSPGREASKEQIKRLRESEMAAFDALSRQTH